MVLIPPFAVEQAEQWMDEYETSAKYNIAETCVASLSLKDLASLSEDKAIQASDIIDLGAVQNYGEIRGSTTLRKNLSRLYSAKVVSPLPPEQVLITPGAIAANYLVISALIEPGDHVIVHHPTYQQLYSVPSAIGAEVDLWKSRPEDQWLPNFDELKALVKASTKMIIVNNPQNPTGRILPKSLLRQLVEFAEAQNITILSDEVYRPLFHGITPMDAEFPPSMLSLGYRNVVVTGSLSKAYSLAGIRVGWLASRDPALIEKCAATRHYTTISVSILDQAIASFALSAEVVHALLGRNVQLARTNLEALERFIVKHDEYCSWTKPVAGTTAFVKFEREGRPIDAKAFCQAVQKKTGVMLLPGDVGFGEEFKGYVRFGYANRTEIVKEGLEELRKFMRKEYENIPVCE